MRLGHRSGMYILVLSRKVKKTIDMKDYRSQETREKYNSFFVSNLVGDQMFSTEYCIIRSSGSSREIRY